MRFRRLLAISALWAWTYALTGTFVGAWLWHHHSGLVIAIASDLIGFAVMAVIFKAMRRAPARIAPKTLLVCAYALTAANLGLLIGLGARIRHWFALVAGFSGLAIGLFWLALFVLASVLVPRKRIRTYQGLTGGLETAAGILGPLVAGWLIGHLGARTGYPVLFTAALFSTGAGLLIVLSTPASAASGAKLRTADPVPPGWPILMRGIGLLGLRDGLYLMVPSLVVYIGSQSAIRMGVFLAVEGAAQAVVFALLSGRSPHPFWSLYGGILNLAAAVLWTVPPQPHHPVHRESWVLAAVDRSGHRLPDRTRLTAAKERWLNAGRSLGLGLLAIILVLAPRMEMLRAFLAGWSLIALYLGWITTQRALSPRTIPNDDVMSENIWPKLSPTVTPNTTMTRNKTKRGITEFFTRPPLLPLLAVARRAACPPHTNFCAHRTTWKGGGQGVSIGPERSPRGAPPGMERPPPAFR